MNKSSCDIQKEEEVSTFSLKLKAKAFLLPSGQALVTLSGPKHITGDDGYTSIPPLCPHEIVGSKEVEDRLYVLRQGYFCFDEACIKVLPPGIKAPECRDYITDLQRTFGRIPLKDDPPNTIERGGDVYTLYLLGDKLAFYTETMDDLLKIWKGEVKLVYKFIPL